MLGLRRIRRLRLCMSIWELSCESRWTSQREMKVHVHTRLLAQLFAENGTLVK
jgi:hypothetical protein